MTFAKLQASLLPTWLNSIKRMNDQVDIDCAGLTDIGRHRDSNQDQYLIADLHKNMHVLSSSIALDDQQVFGESMGKLLFVADGMGGMNAGDVASKLAIAATMRFLLNSMHWLFDPRQPEIEQFVGDLKAAAEFSHGIVRKDAENVPHHQGMGSTLTLACIIWPMLYVLHVGDSRCYVMHKNSLVLLTRDQTFAQYLFDSGAISEDEFAKSPLNNVLVSAIGGSDEPTAAVYQQPLDDVDRLLLCSDGVSEHWSDEELETLLRSDRDSSEICREIVDVANQRGGLDNITVVTARFIPR